MSEWSPNKEDICRHRFLLQKLKCSQRFLSMCVLDASLRFSEDSLGWATSFGPDCCWAFSEVTHFWMWIPGFPYQAGLYSYSYALPQLHHPVQASTRIHVLLTCLSSVTTLAPGNLMVYSPIATYAICSARSMFTSQLLSLVLPLYETWESTTCSKSFARLTGSMRLWSECHHTYSSSVSQGYKSTYIGSCFWGWTQCWFYYWVLSLAPPWWPFTSEERLSRIKPWQFSNRRNTVHSIMTTIH